MHVTKVRTIRVLDIVFPYFCYILETQGQEKDAFQRDPPANTHPGGNLGKGDQEETETEKF